MRKNNNLNGECLAMLKALSAGLGVLSNTRYLAALIECALAEAEHREHCVSDIVARMGISQAAASRLVSSLARDGLVDVYQQERDMRRSCIKLTAKGRRVVHKTAEAMRGTLEG